MKWPTFPLAKLAVELQPGFAQQPNGEEGGLPHLRTNNVSEEGHIDLSSIKTILPNREQREKYSLQPFDILFNNTNSPALVGKTALFAEKGEFLFSNHMTRIRVRPNLANPSYIARYLHWVWKTGGFRHMVTQWVSQAAINRTQLTRLHVPLPPPSEQHRIVEILDQADALRKKRNEADAKAERILPALFHKMFGDPITNPQRWHEVPLSKVLRQKDGALQSGPFGSSLHNSDFVESGTVLAVGIDNVHDAGFRLGRNRRITSEKYEELKKYGLEPGDVLITVMGTVGRTCVFPDGVGTAICTKHVYRIQTESSKLNPDFLSASFRFSPKVRLQLGSSITGQIVDAVTSKHLRELVIQQPPLRLQERFAQIKKQLDREMARRGQASSKQDLLLEAILHRAFSGDLTAKWREAHMKELLREMEEQAKALATANFFNL